jgi:hypothetical protein
VARDSVAYASMAGLTGVNNDSLADGLATVRQLLEDANVLLKRCEDAADALLNSGDYDENTRSLAIREFSAELRSAITRLRQAALHPPSEGRLL